VSRLKLPVSALRLYFNSCTKSTWIQYEMVMKKYFDYCKQRNVNPFSSSLDIAISFISSLFDNGFGYSYINLARSSLSTLLPSIDNCKIGEHPMVVRIVKGVGRLRPPKCRYNVTWDVNLVLNLYKTWGENGSLSLKKLTLKLVGLLSLVTAQRCQTLECILISDIIVGSSIQIRISKQLKTFNPRKSQPVINIAPYNNDESLCVVSCMKAYLSKTKSFRNQSNGKLFVGLKYPHKNVGTQTISNWLQRVLGYAGVDTSIFKGHSYRHASTSKAAKLGVSIDKIFAQAGWCQGSTVFGRFYNKPIVNEEYSNAVLSC